MLKIDNFYTKPKLAEHLLQHKTLLCSTGRANSKGLPNDITKKLPVGQSKYVRKKIVAFRSVQEKKIPKQSASSEHLEQSRRYNKDSKKQTNHKTSSNF